MSIQDLVTSVQHSNFEEVNEMLQNGLDVNGFMEHGRFALIEAFNPEMLALLIASGADVNLQGSPNNDRGDIHTGKTTLHEVCGRLWLQGVEILLKQPGIDVNRKCRMGDTPLTTTVMNLRESVDMMCALDIVERLIKANADVTISSDSCGLQPLIILLKWAVKRKARHPGLCEGKNVALLENFMAMGRGNMPGMNKPESHGVNE